MNSLLSVAQTAELLNVSTWTVRKWLATRKLEYVKLGRAVRIEPAAIEKLIADGRQPASL